MTENIKHRLRLLLTYLDPSANYDEHKVPDGQGQVLSSSFDVMMSKVYIPKSYLIINQVPNINPEQDHFNLTEKNSLCDLLENKNVIFEESLSLVILSYRWIDGKNTFFDMIHFDDNLLVGGIVISPYDYIAKRYNVEIRPQMWLNQNQSRLEGDLADKGRYVNKLISDFIPHIVHTLMEKT